MPFHTVAELAYIFMEFGDLNTVITNECILKVNHMCKLLRNAIVTEGF